MSEVNLYEDDPNSNRDFKQEFSAFLEESQKLEKSVRNGCPLPPDFISRKVSEGYSQKLSKERQLQNEISKNFNDNNNLI